MKAGIGSIVVALVLTAGTGHADGAAEAKADIIQTMGFFPTFFKAVPEAALEGTWEEMKTLQMSSTTAVSPKYKELIGLAVSAQIPCTFCVYAHTKFAKANGATDAEISEAVVMGGLTRHWSTFMNGIQLDPNAFKAEITKLTDAMGKAAAAKTPPAAPLKVVDAATARQDVARAYGFVPEFLKAFPDSGLAGAWKLMRDVEMSPTAIPGKFKSLIGLAVASQIPCSYCVVADTAFAKLEGATEPEIREAVAMASFTRYMSTVLNGLQTDEATFKKDIDRLVKPVPKAKLRGALTPAPTSAPM
jgi:AhpD family alkylhydroperoxidase